MSKYFIQTNKEGAKATFKKKQMFKAVSVSDYSNLVDFNYGEKRLYGRVDRYFLPIVPNEVYFELKNLKTSTPDPIRVFSFVADAFAELQNKFKIKFANGEISKAEGPLSRIEAVSAYKDPKVIFDKHMNSFSMAVGNVIESNNLKFRNFQEFINVLMPFIKNFLRNNVITYPAFVKSKECPMDINGLVINIAEIAPNNDDGKYEQFYNSKNWEFFLNACNTYGFMVDCNMPNKIIADINSPNMISKMMSYNSQISSADLFITNCYDPVSVEYFVMFKTFLYTIYSDNKPRTVITTVNNSYDGTKVTVHKVKPYTFKKFTEEITDDVLLKLYMKIRFMEEESQFTDYEKKVITRDTAILAQTRSVTEALTIFEQLLNKTFDYSGSLSYINKRHKDLGR